MASRYRRPLRQASRKARTWELVRRHVMNTRSVIIPNKMLDLVRISLRKWESGIRLLFDLDCVCHRDPDFQSPALCISEPLEVADPKVRAPLHQASCPVPSVSSGIVDAHARTDVRAGHEAPSFASCSLPHRLYEVGSPLPLTIGSRFGQDELNGNLTGLVTNAPLPHHQSALARHLLTSGLRLPNALGSHGSP